MLTGQCTMSARVILVVIASSLIVCLVSGDNDEMARVNRRIPTKLPSKFKPMVLPGHNTRRPVVGRPVTAIYQPTTEVVIVRKPVYTQNDDDDDETSEEDGINAIADVEDDEEEEEEEGTEEVTEEAEETGAKQADKKKKPRKQHKKMKRALMALLLAYKLKFATLIPTMIGGLVLLVSTTALAGFFFAIFAALLGLRGN